MTRPGLTPEAWARIEAVVDEAAALPPGHREACLDRAGLDAALRTEAEALLDALDRDPDFLETTPPWIPEAPAGGAGAGVPGIGGAGAPGAHGAQDPVARDAHDAHDARHAQDAHDADADPAAPDRIGPYRIVRLLGRGGMGRVYLAEREAPGFRRQVALKLMRRGLDTDDVLDRFRAERQILASLDHPNIARLHEVGATDDGLPYFIMEYIEGDDVVEHCRSRDLSIRDRLALFRAICAAVHHAHQGLVVHRDLKPGNILVTDAGVPKLLDFGIAKILDPERASDHTTRIGARLLTPRYSSPEQLRGERITTACDVWALGVLLYELLAGPHPFTGGEPSSEGIGRFILERDPPPPSATAPEPLRRALAGDLDVIVLEALRKEPGKRYASAAALADDIERHLAGMPVEARPATLRYRFHTFVRRNRGAVAGTAGLVLLLTAFSVVTAYQARRIGIEAERATAERDKALAVRSFLLETFGITGPDRAGADTLAVRDLLDSRVATLDDTYATDPALRAEMRGVLAEAYDQLGLYAEALPLARRALDEKRALHGDVHADVAAALTVLGWIQRQNGDLDAAEATLREAVRIGRAVFPAAGDARLARALNDLGVVLEAGGDYDQAADLYRESLAMRRRLLGDGSPGVAVTTSNLAVVLYRRGALDSAATMAAAAVESFRDALGEDHQRTVIALGNLAAINGLRGAHQAVAETWERILERHRRVLGERHAQTAYAMMMRASALARLDRHFEAEPLARRALAIHRELLGARHGRVSQNLRVLADIELALGRPEAALADFGSALDIARVAWGEVHKDVAAIHLRIARIHAALGADARAGAEFREAIRIFTAAVGEVHLLTADAELVRLEFLLDRGRTADAAPLAARIAPAVDSLAASFPYLAARLDTIRQRIGDRR